MKAALLGQPIMQQIKRPKSLTAMATQQVRAAIINGDLGLGEPLSEGALAERLGISKTPVREALAQLRVEGLVTIMPQKGTFVFTLSAAEVRELAELRKILECGALELAFARNRIPLATGLRSVFDRMEVAFANQDVREYLRLDADFHSQLFQHCANSYLADAYQLIEGKVSAVRTHLAARPKHTLRSFAEHRSIVSSIERDNLSQALSVMRKHVTRASETYAQNIEDIAAVDG